MTTTSTELTRDPSLPAPPDAAGAADERRRLRWGAYAALAVLVLLGFLAAVVPLPYTAIEPGAATPVAGLVSVGDGTRLYPPEHSVAFTTISEASTTLLSVVRGWFDDHVQIVRTSVLTGGQSREENNRFNRQLMDTSKLTAEYVALQRLGLPVTIVTAGTYVQAVGRGSPAAGVLKVNDLITAVDGHTLDRLDQIRGYLQVGGPGAEHTLTVQRGTGADARRLSLSLRTVADTTGDQTRAIVGIAPAENIVDVRLPFPVSIDSGNVGGPSAGLAFTLALLDDLTPGELTGGHRVAVTGTMDFDGVVGPVGGAVQKAIAVRKAGYEVFLVPPDEYKDVQATVGHDLKVIPVSTLQQALDALKSLGGDVDSLGPAGTATAP
jgi:PDZ domain-containing protein